MPASVNTDGGDKRFLEGERYDASSRSRDGPTNSAEANDIEHQRQRELWARDMAVRASIAAAESPDGSLRGLPAFEYDVGPDGRPYAVGDSGIRAQIPAPQSAQEEESLQAAKPEEAIQGQNGRDEPEHKVGVASSEPATGFTLVPTPEGGGAFGFAPLDEHVAGLRDAPTEGPESPSARAQSTGLAPATAPDPYSSSAAISQNGSLSGRSGHAVESVDVWA